MPDMTYAWDDIDRRIRRSMARVLDNDLWVLQHGPSERAVAHRLAVYLEQEFSGWSTDCEYNRQGDEGGRKKAVLSAYELPKAVDPDIIVHRRGPDGPNLLVIEVKPASGDDNDKEHDRQKLQAYLEKPHSYAFAVFLTYECKEKTGSYEIKQIEPRRDKWRKG
ncbi:MAG TPA: hypothetical protein VJM31_12300 [Vicinamibacterales bacterium]|nr:hypothetical protein [Vicinamibacterales bacterium]